MTKPPAPKIKRTPHLVAWEKSEIIAACAARDGWKCCYCVRRVTRMSVTIEHFVARAVGGPNHISNYGLACSACNVTVGDKPVAEKIRYAIECRTLARRERQESTFNYFAALNRREEAA